MRQRTHQPITTRTTASGIFSLARAWTDRWREEKEEDDAAAVVVVAVAVEVAAAATHVRQCCPCIGQSTPGFRTLKH
ncbi:hypothetical protein TSMEX_005074 [Taenia solium]|eukprot:TsM_000335500 transcript=TsM_000335500 gene=TsM_000335500